MAKADSIVNFILPGPLLCLDTQLERHNKGWLPTGFGTSICYKHSDGRTGGSCSVVLVVSPLVYLIMEAIAATLQAVYLVWLFLRITTTCNLSIIGLVRKRCPESLAHAQAVDTRPLFPPPTWPGYEATHMPAIVTAVSLYLYD